MAGMMSTATAAAAGGGWVPANWSALSADSADEAASLERMWSGDCSTAAAHVISALPPPPPTQRRRRSQPQPQQQHLLPWQQKEDDPHVGSFGGPTGRRSMDALGSPRIEQGYRGGGGGEASMGTGSSGRPLTAAAAACSRAAVGRYGTLMMSSAGWRCTELYDMHDSLLLSRLSAMRVAGGGAVGGGSGGDDGMPVFGYASSTMRAGPPWALVGTTGSAIAAGWERRDSDLEVVQEGAGEPPAAAKETDLKAAAMAAAETASAGPFFPRGSLVGPLPAEPPIDRSSSRSAGGTPQQPHNHQPQPQSLPLPQRSAAALSRVGAATAPGVSWGVALEALLEKAVSRPGYYAAAGGGRGCSEGGGGCEAVGAGAGCGGAGSLVERSSRGQLVMSSMRRWVGQVRARVGGTGDGMIAISTAAAAVAASAAAPAAVAAAEAEAKEDARSSRAFRSSRPSRNSRGSACTSTTGGIIFVTSGGGGDGVVSGSITLPMHLHQNTTCSAAAAAPTSVSDLGSASRERITPHGTTPLAPLGRPPAFLAALQQPPPQPQPPQLVSPALAAIREGSSSVGLAQPSVTTALSCAVCSAHGVEGTPGGFAVLGPESTFARAAVTAIATGAYERLGGGGFGAMSKSGSGIGNGGDSGCFGGNGAFGTDGTRPGRKGALAPSRSCGALVPRAWGRRPALSWKGDRTLVNSTAAATMVVAKARTDDGCDCAGGLPAAAARSMVLSCNGGGAFAGEEGGGGGSGEGADAGAFPAAVAAVVDAEKRPKKKRPAAKLDSGGSGGSGDGRGRHGRLLCVLLDALLPPRKRSASPTGRNQRTHCSQFNSRTKPRTPGHRTSGGTGIAGTASKQSSHSRLRRGDDSDADGNCSRVRSGGGGSGGRGGQAAALLAAHSGRRSGAAVSLSGGGGGSGAESSRRDRLERIAPLAAALLSP